MAGALVVLYVITRVRKMAVKRSLRTLREPTIYLLAKRFQLIRLLKYRLL